MQLVIKQVPILQFIYPDETEWHCFSDMKIKKIGAYVWHAIVHELKYYLVNSNLRKNKEICFRKTCNTISNELT